MRFLDACVAYRPFVLLHGSAGGGTLGTIIGTENVMLQRLHRNNLSLNVPASCADSGLPLGRLSDLSLGGFCLVGTGMPPEQTDAEIDIRLPWSMQGVTRIRLVAQLRWCKRTAGGRWHAGYRIVSCPEDEVDALSYLSASFASRARSPA